MLFGVDQAALRSMLDGVRRGDITPDDAVRRLRTLPYADLGFARVDHHRALRQGMAEAVYAPGKEPDQCAAIVAELLAQPGSSPVILTRADPVQVAATLNANPGGTVTSTGGDRAVVVWRSRAEVRPPGVEPATTEPGPGSGPVVLVVTAGTADLPVADECAAVLAAIGLPPVRITDVGVAGLHRILDAVDELAAADAVIVVAGMEGALASVVGGLTAAPVVAVPTSTGYGAAFEGVTALLGMVASCASGVTVVGIDNGFGAAVAVGRVLAAPRRATGLEVDVSESEPVGGER